MIPPLASNNDIAIAMKVLHISNGYAGSKVHSNLAKHLDDLGVEQTIYCPVREKRLLGGNQFEGKQIDFHYSFCIKSWYKYVYHYKTWRLYQDLKRKVDIGSCDVLFAPTLFSDGALAYNAFKEYGIPYIVAVRNTDINLYIHNLKHTYGAGRKIAKNASKIIFISKGEMDEFKQSEFAKPILPEIENKIVLQPNGIDDYWHEHKSHEQKCGHDILYIGDYTPNKNVARLSQAILNLKQSEQYRDIRLIIVGGANPNIVHKNDSMIEELITQHPDTIIAKGKIYDKDKLSDVMQQCTLFAMPSIHETFGLVYIEALSQNLPVVYSKGQGIDGLFDSTVGIGVDALSVDSIADAIRQILDNRSNYSNAHVNFDDFRLSNIAQKYKTMFEETSEPR